MTSVPGSVVSRTCFPIVRFLVTLNEAGQERPADGLNVPDGDPRMLRFYRGAKSVGCTAR
jgi:hypothetical protein